MGTVSTLKALYTWDTANFSWGAFQCTNETWDNFGIYSHNRSDTHYISVGERKRRDLGKCAKEKIKPAERLSRSLTTLAGRENITTQETYWDLINYLLKVVENASIVDKNANSTAHAENERVAIADNRTISLSSLTLEQVAVIDQALRHAEFHKGFDEAVKAMEFHANHAETKAKEQTSIKEYRRQDMKQGSREHVDFLETLRHIADMKREFAENVNAAAGYATHYTEKQQEEFHTKDKKFHAADCVLDDVAVKKGAMDMDAFKILVNQPAGYEHFIPYIVGEYEYQKALVRLSIEAGSAGAEPAVYDAVIHVDIDDTVDRGKTAITDTSKATRIHFSKHYYTKPEVAVALYSGNTKDGAITPNITDIDKDDAGYYFEVELLKDDYTRTTGTISWQAVGY